MQNWCLKAWSDLIHIYKPECESFVKLAKLNHATLYPSNFEKQKVCLIIEYECFNEKTVAVWPLNDKKNTAVFVNAVTQLRNCLNIKTRDGLVLLNDKNREPFSSLDDPRFEKMLRLTE